MKKIEPKKESWWSLIILFIIALIMSIFLSFGGVFR